MNVRNDDIHYTYSDYSELKPEARYELIDGIIYALAAPGVRHNLIIRELSKRFYTYLDGKKCQAFTAPLDVRLNADEGDDTVVQPDIIIVCDPQKWADGKSVTGAPDLVAEVLSPTTAKVDRVLKLEAYRKAGVREYWIIDPVHEMTDVYVQENFTSKWYGRENIQSCAIEGLIVNMDDVFKAVNAIYSDK